METHDMMDLAAVKETGKSVICRTEGGSSYEEPKPYWPVGGLFHLFDAVCPPVFLGRISGTERTAICLAAFRFCRPCFLPAVVVMPAGKCPMDPLTPPLYPVPCSPGRSGLLLRVCGQRLGHFGGRYPPMLVHCPSGGVCFGLADLRWETPAQAGYGRAGHSAGGLCETQSYGWTFWRFRVNGLARHSRSGDGDMVAA